MSHTTEAYFDRVMELVESAAQAQNLGKNEVCDSMDEAVERIKGFLDDLVHDLRAEVASPMTLMSGYAVLSPSELARMTERDEESLGFGIVMLCYDFSVFLLSLSMVDDDTYKYTSIDLEQSAPITRAEDRVSLIDYLRRSSTHFSSAFESLHKERREMTLH